MVFNHLFHRVWNKVPDKVNVPGKRRRIHSLQELDENISNASNSSQYSGGKRTQRDYFDDEELQRIRQAADMGGDRLRDNLIISILECTGLRRMGLLNILINEVADREEGSEPGICIATVPCHHRWVALTSGQTLTKGRTVHHFKMPNSVRVHIEKWMNTPEGNGGRPQGPCPFLLPSGQRDNGQMSTSTLTRNFETICRRAGFENDKRVHLHTMRHSCAHSLARRGNAAKQISAVLGHKSEKLTSEVYLRETQEHALEGLALPSHWELTKSNVAEKDHQGTVATGDADMPPSMTETHTSPQADLEHHEKKDNATSSASVHRRSARELHLKALDILKQVVESR